jgi:hypothetical protein
MIDRIFSAVLTFCVLVAGTLAIGSLMFGHTTHHAAVVATAAVPRVIQLPLVVITAHRQGTAMAEAEASRPTVD